MQMQTGVICCQNSQPDAFKSQINYSITGQSSCPLVPLTFSSSEQAVCKHVALHLLVNGCMIPPGLSGRLKGKSLKSQSNFNKHTEAIEPSISRQVPLGNITSSEVETSSQ